MMVSGAVVIQDHAMFEAYDTILYNNSAKYGGAIFVSARTSSAVVMLRRVVLINNNATAGAGLYIAAQGQLQGYNISVKSNRPDGIYNDGTAELDSGSVVCNNVWHQITGHHYVVGTPMMCTDPLKILVIISAGGILLVSRNFVDVSCIDVTRNCVYTEIQTATIYEVA